MMMIVMILMHTFDIEFTVKAEGIPLEAEAELKRIYEDIVSRAKEFKLIQTDYTLNVRKVMQ